MRADAVLTSWSYSPNQAAEDSGELLVRVGAAAVALTKPEVSSLLGILLSYEITYAQGCHKQKLMK